MIIDIRLGYVQFVLGNSLTDKARDSWSRNIPFEPERGLILDRNNVPIAENKSAPTVYIVPRQIEDPARSAEMLANVLDVPVDKVYKRMTANSSIERLPEGRKISYEKARDVRALNIKGVYIAEDSKRHYPFGRYLSHVLGFTGIDNQGLMGLELYYDEELQGKKDRSSSFRMRKEEGCRTCRMTLILRLTALICG